MCGHALKDVAVALEDMAGALTLLPAEVRMTKAGRSGDGKKTANPQWALAILLQAVNSSKMAPSI